MFSVRGCFYLLVGYLIILFNYLLFIIINYYLIILLVTCYFCYCFYQAFLTYVFPCKLLMYFAVGQSAVQLHGSAGLCPYSDKPKQWPNAPSCCRDERGVWPATHSTAGPNDPRAVVDGPGLRRATAVGRAHRSNGKSFTGIGDFYAGVTDKVIFFLIYQIDCGISRVFRSEKRIWF